MGRANRTYEIDDAITEIMAGGPAAAPETLRLECVPQPAPVTPRRRARATTIDALPVQPSQALPFRGGDDHLASGALPSAPGECSGRTMPLAAATEAALPFQPAPGASWIRQLSGSTTTPPSWITPPSSHTHASSGVSERSDRFITIERYAIVRARVWRGEPLASLLAEYGIDQRQWDANERRQAVALAREAGEGRSDLAAELGNALEEARRTMADADLPQLSLDEFVTLVGQVDGSSDPVTVLTAAGMDTTTWKRLRRDWNARALADRRVARELRTRLGALRPSHPVR